MSARSASASCVSFRSVRCCWMYLPTCLTNDFVFTFTATSSCCWGAHARWGDAPEGETALRRETCSASRRRRAPAVRRRPATSRPTHGPGGTRAGRRRATRARRTTRATTRTRRGGGRAASRVVPRLPGRHQLEEGDLILPVLALLPDDGGELPGLGGQVPLPVREVLRRGLPLFLQFVELREGGGQLRALPLQLVLGEGDELLTQFAHAAAPSWMTRVNARNSAGWARTYSAASALPESVTRRLR